MDSKQTQKSDPYLKNVPSAVPLIIPSWKSGAKSVIGWKKDARIFMSILKLENKIMMLKKNKKNPNQQIIVETRCRKKSQTYWTTQQVTNSVLSFKCFLASFLDRHATDWDFNKPSPPCRHGQQLITSQTWSHSCCSRGNGRVILKSCFT